MDTQYRCVLLDDEESFTKLAQRWSYIESLDTELTPFNTFDWLSLWWQHYKKPGMKLHLLQFFHRDEMIGLAPLYIAPIVQLKVIKQQELRWLGYGGDTSPDYLNLVCLPEHRANAIRLFAQYLADFTGVHRIHLTDLVKPSLLYSAVSEQLGSNNGMVESTISNFVPLATLPSTWQDYRMGLTRKRRKQINHRRNRMDKAGVWSLHIAENTEQIELAMDALEALHRQRWISKGEPGSFSSQAYIDFHRAVVNRFFSSEQLWLVTLQLNGEVIGVLYLFCSQNCLWFFQSGFSPEHESLSPGHVMFTYVISQAIERGIGRIDLLKGDYKYKTVYAKEKRETTNLLYYRPGLASLIGRLKKCVRR